MRCIFTYKQYKSAVIRGITYDLTPHKYYKMYEHNQSIRVQLDGRQMLYSTDKYVQR